MLCFSPPFPSTSPSFVFLISLPLLSKFKLCKFTISKIIFLFAVTKAQTLPCRVSPCWPVPGCPALGVGLTQQGEEAGG